MRLKKLLLIGVIIVVVLSFFVPNLMTKAIPSVTICYVKQINFTPSVNASGVLEDVGESKVTTDTPLVISEVLVKEGDTVTEGQTLALVDQAATQTLASSVDTSGIDLSTITGTPNLLSGMQDIPENIVSPCDGIITSVGIQSGDTSTPSKAIISIKSNNSMEAKVSINEANISDVALGQQAEITGSGFKNRIYQATVARIGKNARKMTSGTGQQVVVDVYLSINNADDKLKSGFTAQAKIFTEKTRKILTIPYEAVCQDDSNQEYVYLYRNGRALKQNIVTGIELEDSIEVKQGLTADMVVILTPQKVKKNNGIVAISSKGGQKS